MFKQYIYLLGILVGFFLPLGGFAAENSFESSRVCRDCHRDIYRSWEKSLHALSYTNPIFVTAFRKAYTETAGKAKKYCLNCHAPTVRITGDYDAELPLTREGVTCDFCHTISEIRLNDGETEFVNLPGRLKRSALKKAKSPYHDTAYSKDFASSKLCAGCHDFKNRFGVHVGVTFSEWQKSSFARAGKQCQHCHMPEIEGKTVIEGGRDRIHDHSLSHNIQSMKNAILLDTMSLVKDAKTLKVKIRIKNARVGHAIPTGTPARRLILEVRTLDGAGKVIESQKKSYRKIIVDDKGVEINGDGDVFLFGRKIKSDTRLKPDEARIETFLFTSRVKEIKHIEAEVYFFYQPTVTQKVDMRIPLFQEEWEIKDSRF